MCRLLCCFDVARTVDLAATVDGMVAAFDDEPPEMLSSGVLLLRGDGTGLTLDKQVAGVRRGSRRRRVAVRSGELAFVHVRNPMPARPESVTAVNVQPLLLDRFVCMHNGWIEGAGFEGGPLTSDSRRLFRNWFQQQSSGSDGQSLATSLSRYMRYLEAAPLTHRLMNVVVYDSGTGELVAYRGRARSEGFPSMFVHREESHTSVSNFRRGPDDVELRRGQMWTRK
jgi:hypothetical protein